jgi:hypothetical protein
MAQDAGSELNNQSCKWQRQRWLDSNDDIGLIKGPGCITLWLTTTADGVAHLSNFMAPEYNIVAQTYQCHLYGFPAWQFGS